MARREERTDAQWAILAPFIPVQPRRAAGRGRAIKPVDRAVLKGVLWSLRTGAAWADLPERFPSGSTCFRQFSRWVKAGGMRKLLETLARDLEERGPIDLAECFIAGTFGVAKKGAKVGKTKRGKGTKLMVMADAHGLPPAMHTAAASPHEVTLVEATLAATYTVGRPRRLIGERGYDRDPLAQTLAAQGIELSAPPRRNRQRVYPRWSPPAALSPPLEDSAPVRLPEQVQACDDPLGSLS
jgi:transposase